MLNSISHNVSACFLPPMRLRIFGGRYKQLLCDGAYFPQYNLKTIKI